jgi:hypothetical protein
MSRATAWLSLSAVALLALQGACSGEPNEIYVANLDGSFEGVTTEARGRAVLVVARGEGRADVSLEVSGISGVTGAHIHHAPKGLNGPIVFFLWRPAFGPFDPAHPVGRTWDRATADPQTFTEETLRELRNGNYYVNVHTESRPSGEIRGQLLLQ